MRLLSHRFVELLALFLPVFCAQADQALPNKPIANYQGEDIAHALGWQKDTQANVCHGYYQLNPAVEGQKPKARLSDAETDVSANQSTFFSKQGTSVFSGDVRATQKGRFLNARKAYVKRDPKTGEVSELRLIGPLVMEDPMIRAVSHYAQINFNTNRSTLDDVYYRLYNPDSAVVEQDAWGRAKRITQTKDKVLHFKHATYSTCQPGNSAWRLHASELALDNEAGQGWATHAWVDFYGVPIFYTPYYSFSLRKQRKTGFLSPRFNRSSRQGYVATVPFYWNIAPNYDATFTSQWMSLRGYKLNNQLRYLTEHSQGQVRFERMFNDEAFKKFKRKRVPANQTNIADTSLRRLAKADTSRSYFGFQHQTHFNDFWKGKIQLNYVTDDYYFQDFKPSLSGATQTQLLNQGELKYKSQHWNGLAQVQAYQTLHPVNGDDVDDKYSRLPDIQWDGHYNDLPQGFELDWDNQATYFDHAQTFADEGDPFPTGLRFYTGPKISWPFRRKSGFVKPALKLHAVAYRLFTPGDKDKNTTRLIPSVSLDSGLYFVRPFNMMGHRYEQTLEPRFFYVYTPTVNQEDQPNFDTTSPAFNFSRLFAMNRFVGVDRVSNDNRASVGLESRMRDPYTGREMIKAQLGEGVLFQKRRVCLDKKCSEVRGTNNALTPLYAGLTYHISERLTLSSHGAYSPSLSKMNNAGSDLRYHDQRNRIIDLGYDFVDQGDDFDGAPDGDSRNDLNRAHAGISWPVYHHWHAIAYGLYNISHGWLQNEFYGIEYSGCCWALRLMASRNVIAVRNNSPAFDRNIFVQFQLKGLGGVETEDPHKMLSSNLSGYNDVFGDD